MIFEKIRPPSQESFFLGIGENGAPVTISAERGPLLAAVNDGTEFLQVVARGLLQHNPKKVSFGVITETPEKWAGFNNIYPDYANSSRDYIFSLGDWIHYRKPGEVTGLIIHNLMRTDRLPAEIQDTLFERDGLLRKGPTHGLLTVATINPGEWSKRSGYFKLKVSMAGKPGEFILTENGTTVRFWQPSLT